MSDEVVVRYKAEGEIERRSGEGNLWFFVLERLVRDLVSLSRDDPYRRNAARDWFHFREYIEGWVIPASGVSDGAAEKLIKLIREKAYETFDGEDFDEVLKYARGKIVQARSYQR